MKQCPKCDSFSTRFCGDASTGLHDELTELRLYGCRDCDLIFLDGYWNEDLEEWWQKTDNIPFKNET